MQAVAASWPGDRLALPCKIPRVSLLVSGSSHSSWVWLRYCLNRTRPLRSMPTWDRLSCETRAGLRTEESAMQGWVTHAFKDMRLEQLPDPECRPGWAVLKTKVVQPSVTEVQLFYGERSNSYDKVKKKLAQGPEPLFGHEFCAEIVEIEKDNAYGLAAGDRVGATHTEIGTIGRDFPGPVLRVRGGAVGRTGQDSRWHQRLGGVGVAAPHQLRSQHPGAGGDAGGHGAGAGSRRHGAQLGSGGQGRGRGHGHRHRHETGNLGDGQGAGHRRHHRCLQGERCRGGDGPE